MTRYGYIQFSTEEHATKALTICNGPEPIMISGRPLQVEVCLRRHSLSLENLQKDKVIEEFLTVVDRYENTLAYKYLEVSYCSNLICPHPNLNYALRLMDTI